MKSFNPDLVEKITLFRKAWLNTASNGGKIKISFLHLTKANDVEFNKAYETKKSQLISLVKSKMNQAEIRFEEFSAREIIELFQKQKSSILELKFSENWVPKQFGEGGDYGYIGVVSLPDFCNFILDEESNLNEQIFESNVRHFQGYVDVNKKIEESLQIDYERDFWWLNNGITIITSECNTAPKTLFLKNVQIVNGLQTSFIIARNHKRLKKDLRSLLVKVIVSEDKETIDKIISASNNQTPVTPDILRATDPVQRKIELHFSNHKYWYDRRKNYYKNLGKPLGRIFNIRITAQAVESILYKNPSRARSTPTALVKNEKHYRRIFNENTNFNAYLNSCLICQAVNDYIKSSLQTEGLNLARNFSLHVARVLAAILVGNDNYSANEIANLRKQDITKENARSALKILLDILKPYLDDNPTDNEINVAKSTKFDDWLNTKVADKLT